MAIEPNIDILVKTQMTGTMVGLVLIDLRKASDIVDHNIICQKLEHYGVQEGNHQG